MTELTTLQKEKNSYEFSNFIIENELSPFNKTKPSLKIKNSPFFTSDAKKIHTKTIHKISEKFIFSNTSCLWNYFQFTKSKEEILSRQNFFKNIKPFNNSVLRELSPPFNWWRPPYSIIVVTEDEKTFMELKKLNIPCQLLSSPQDVKNLESYDIVQVINCSTFDSALESFSQTIFVNNIEDCYLERFLVNLSGWEKNINLLLDSNPPEKIRRLCTKLSPLFELFHQEKKVITPEDINVSLKKINELLFEKLKDFSFTGESLVKLLSTKSLPQNIIKLIDECISSSKFSQELYSRSIPVEIDDELLETYIKNCGTNINTALAENIYSHNEIINSLPYLLHILEQELLVFDFLSGISTYSTSCDSFPKISNNLDISSSKNMFLEDAQPISFNLIDVRCSILTGANSGGKTTLLEHLLQLYSLFQLGLPISGTASLPIFSEVYYFAKNKGSANRGAFETLLTQLSSISSSDALILADEIEAVTEPSIASKIISFSAEYFLSKNCFLVFSTHLGRDISKSLPKNCRIDGILAKGLNENNELIVDHCPVLNKLASSTPELIIERLAKNYSCDYFSFLFSSIKS